MSFDEAENLNVDNAKILKNLLAESVAPDPKLLEGGNIKRYQKHVDERIHWRVELLFTELGIDRQTFELATRLRNEATLRENVERILARDDLPTIEERLLKIKREECAVLKAWLQKPRCENCKSEDVQVSERHFQVHELLYPRWLCKTCAKSLMRRQRTTSTNIGPALREARRRKLPATLLLDEWLQTIAHFEDCCAYCGRDWDIVEHVTPIDRNGGTTFVNCLPACRSCNRVKGGRTLEEWINIHHRHEKDLRARRQRALDWLIQNGRSAP